MNEVQVVCTVISTDKNQDPDIAAMIGTSAALSISGIPFKGPIGAARVGFIDGNYILNPGYDVLKDSMLNMMVAGTDGAVLMVESEAKELTEDEMLGAVLFAHQEMQAIITAVAEFATEAGKPSWDWQAEEKDEALLTKVSDSIKADLGEAYRISDKMDRQAKVGDIRKSIVAELSGGDEATYAGDDVSDMFGKVEKDLVRQRVLNGEPRIDGRDLRTVRPIEVEVGVLPKAHGSALFTRGETQALVVATLGTLRDAAMIDALEGSYKDTFMLHYNFPPYSVGEAGFMSGPKRREIGHGKLARRGVTASLPNAEDFPYTIRVVSEITESNGSSSMASVCGTSLALMDAGVPMKAPIAGVAMGLVKEGNRYAVLTDILGDEDHLGDMDFKVAGTAAGVTALQMDIKIDGITEEIMEAAMSQAHEARLHILDEMNKVISVSREELSDNAPAMVTLNVHPDKIRDIIGKGGATIRSIVEETGAEVDINDDGSVRIYAEDGAAKDAAVNRIQEITAEAEVGRIYHGKVERIVDFGAFVNILPGKDGLLHISQIAEERVENVSDYLTEGEEVDVVVLDVDQRGRIKLSIKELPNYQEQDVAEE
jgi:polyribonucleotide nucleotidyltransferase